MCGIAGVTGTADTALIDGMVRAMHHRGPDDKGAVFLAKDGMHLGMSRLAIVDVQSGKQPMSMPDHSLCVVFNGEIFNAPELRRELVASGAMFVTDHSDTEVLLHLYAREGEKMVERLNGMFAFVIYDQARSLLFGARDHCGIKPLFWSEVGGRFAFASEIKALLTLPWIDRSIDTQALSDYFGFQAIAAPRTIFSSIRKIPAGCSFTYSFADKKLRIRPYWTLPVDAYKSDVSHQDPAANPRIVREAFEGAVRRWSMSDVPVAYSLSGGIDSPAIVGASAKILGSKLQTYTLGFSDEPSLDEREQARAVSKKWGTEHHEIVLASDDLLGDLDAMVSSLDEPYGGGLPSWFVFKKMGKHVKVAMTGSGGDELFGNYGKWMVHSSMGKWRRRLSTFLHHGGSLLDVMRYPHGSLHYTHVPDAAQRRSLFRDGVLRDTAPSARYIESLWRSSPDSHCRSAVAFVDFQLQLPEEFLCMTDRFSMAHSIEARTPFLDKELIETVCRIPPHLRTGVGRPKDLLIRAVEDLIPTPLLAAPKKGFILPTGRWLRTSLRPHVERLCGADFLRRQGIFRDEIVETLVRPHMEGKEDRAGELWTLLFFQLWYEKYIR